MLRALASICFVFVVFEVAHSQGWHGIVPLHSSCEDVQRVLGITKCENKTYDLKDATVSIAFSDGSCLSQWKVPAGTVLSLDIHPKPAVRFVDLHLDERKYKRIVDQSDPNIVYYKNYHDGLSIVVLANGMVAYLSYGPSAKDDSLRCSRESVDQEQPIVDVGFWKIDEYGAIGPKEEQSRLDEFARRLRAERTTQAYIIAYGGRRSWPGEARDRANCAKDYLVKKQGIDKRRVVTVDGGYHEEAVVALYTGLENGGPPSASPTVDPRTVQIIKDHRVKIQRGVCRPPNKGRAKRS
jgi:hypothetical protein